MDMNMTTMVSRVVTMISTTTTSVTETTTTAVVNDSATFTSILIGFLILAIIIICLVLLNPVVPNYDCSFCNRSGSIFGLWKSGDGETEQKKAKYCPICGKSFSEDPGKKKKKK
ncbi:MAG: hypothetical protein MJ071_03005 [Oscillospiraceae bacterium]|nr:hypothetical protein [Oscillospiraceae bacterium]